MVELLPPRLDIAELQVGEPGVAEDVGIEERIVGIGGQNLLIDGQGALVIPSHRLEHPLARPTQGLGLGVAQRPPAGEDRLRLLLVVGTLLEQGVPAPASGLVGQGRVGVAFQEELEVGLGLQGVTHGLVGLAQVEVGLGRVRRFWVVVQVEPEAIQHRVPVGILGRLGPLLQEVGRQPEVGLGPGIVRVVVLDQIQGPGGGLGVAHGQRLPGQLLQLRKGRFGQLGRGRLAGRRLLGLRRRPRHPRRRGCPRRQQAAEENGKVAGSGHGGQVHSLMVTWGLTNWWRFIFSIRVVRLTPRSWAAWFLTQSVWFRAWTISFFS